MHVCAKHENDPFSQINVHHRERNGMLVPPPGILSHKSPRYPFSQIMYVFNTHSTISLYYMTGQEFTNTNIRAHVNLFVT